MMRGVRGATCARANSREAVFEATRDLLARLIAANRIEAEHIASVFITATPDLNADYPAYVAREMGLSRVPLLCATEIDVPGAMKRVIRILIHCETEMKQDEVRHLYLRETARLRPDLAGGEE
ncbi:MAG: chorismate mutase [Candidatus Zixiibacteriota bacterium]